MSNGGGSIQELDLLPATGTGLFVTWEDSEVPDPFAERDQLDPALEFAASVARRYLERIGDELVLDPDAEVVIGRWGDPMPEEGIGSLGRVWRRLARAGRGSFIS